MKLKSTKKIPAVFAANPDDEQSVVSGLVPTPAEQHWQLYVFEAFALGRSDMCFLGQGCTAAFVKLRWRGKKK